VRPQRVGRHGWNTRADAGTCTDAGAYPGAGTCTCADADAGACADTNACAGTCAGHDCADDPGDPERSRQFVDVDHGELERGDRQRACHGVPVVPVRG
jgi:hypothetical protein